VLERLLAELRAGREVPLTRRMTPFAGETAIQA